MKQKKQIIMLPSEKPSQIIMTGGKLFIYSAERPKSSIVDNSPQHLYILSDEEIKDGDWYYSIEFKVILQSESTSIEGAVQKIIATTDPDLLSTGDKAIIDYTFKDGIFEIPQHIIEVYVKNPFDEVEVEYWNKSMAWMKHEPNHYPKLNPDGTLYVSLVEEKMYSRKEVEELCRNSHLLGMKETLPGYPKPETIDKWIKENL